MPHIQVTLVHGRTTGLRRRIGQRLAALPLIQGRRLGLWRAFAYLAATLPLLLLVALVLLRPDLNLPQPPDWRPVFAHAEASRREGDWYGAGHLYSVTARLASRQEDWVGLLAAACGMKKLGNGVDPHSKIDNILVRAMMAAEIRQSRAGMSAVADAFAAVGRHEAASMVLARVPKGWREDKEQVQGHISTECWKTFSFDGQRPAAGAR